MSVLTSAHPGHHVVGDSFIRHVGQSVRALWESLLAARRRHAAARDADDLMQMCRRYEDTMPNLASELRFIASCG